VQQAPALEQSSASLLRTIATAITITGDREDFMRITYAAVLWMAALVPCVAGPAVAQQASSSADAAPTWTIDQAVTSSVHEAWVLGGKTEPGFFAIVKAMAELSHKRGIWCCPTAKQPAASLVSTLKPRQGRIAISYCMRSWTAPSANTRSNQLQITGNKAPRHRWLISGKKQQVPPLRFAPVGMTILLPGSTGVPLHLLRLQQNCHPDRSVAQWRDLLFLPGCQAFA
jgi:hypothetical protein